MASAKLKRSSATLFFPGEPGESTGKAGRTAQTWCYAGIDASSGVPFIEPEIDDDLLRLVRFKIRG